MQLLPPDPEAEAAERTAHQEWEAVTRVLADVVEREQSANAAAGQPVNYTDDEIAATQSFLMRLIRTGTLPG